MYNLSTKAIIDYQLTEALTLTLSIYNSYKGEIDNDNERQTHSLSTTNDSVVRNMPSTSFIQSDPTLRNIKPRVSIEQQEVNGFTILSNINSLFNPRAGNTINQYEVNAPSIQQVNNPSIQHEVNAPSLQQVNSPSLQQVNDSNSNNTVQKGKSLPKQKEHISSNNEPTNLQNNHVEAVSERSSLKRSNHEALVAIPIETNNKLRRVTLKVTR